MVFQMISVQISDVDIGPGQGVERCAVQGNCRKLAFGSQGSFQIFQRFVRVVIAVAIGF